MHGSRGSATIMPGGVGVGEGGLQYENNRICVLGI